MTQPGDQAMEAVFPLTHRELVEQVTESLKGCETALRLFMGTLTEKDSELLRETARVWLGVHKILERVQTKLAQIPLL